MTTPQPDPGVAGGSRLVGTNSLQDAIQALTQAVAANTSATQQARSNAPGGTPVPFGSSGQTFTSGSFPRMQSVFSAFQGSGAGNAANYATTPTGGTGNGQGGWGNPQATLGAAGNSLGSQAAGMFAGGGSQFSTQIMMNQYASMSSLGMGPGTNLQQGFKAMYSQAFGSYGSNLNAVALNAQDAAQGFSTLQGIAASPYVNSTALGRAGYSAYAGFGVSNPSLGAAGSAAAAAQLYNPQTSMMMRMYGYGATPRSLGGNGNPLQMGSVMQTLLQRWYGKGSVNQNTLNASLANGGKGQINLQALGMDPSTYGPALQMYNKLFSQGLNANQAQTLLNDAAQNKTYGNQGSAQKLLSNKYGIATSDLQKIKDTTAIGTSTTAGEMSSFDSTLSAATTAVRGFENAITKFLKVTGLGNQIGGMKGFMGGLGSFGGPISSIMSSGVNRVVGMLGSFGGASGSGGAGGGASSQGGTPGSSMSSMSRQASTAIKDAETMLGRPYVWGGDNPSVGFDCSGLVEWAYGQAGVKLPRTSQQQWAALQNRSVPLGKVRAGDIVFSAGSDGSFDSPGHEALMISNNQLIEAPYTGANIRIRAYNQGEWQHAGRPSGSMNGGGGGFNTGTSSNGNSSAATSTGSGNGGLGLAVGNYGSSSETQNLAAALLGGSMTGYSGGGMGSIGNGQGSGSVTTPNVSAPNNPSVAQAQAIGKKLAAAYGWGSGTQWNDLVQLWNDESGWRWNAQNASGAYGIPQALPGSKMASAGADWRTNVATQEKWGFGYIKGRYGSPAAALAHENMVHWYADGTPGAHPGYALIGERGPELVRLSGGQQVMNASKTRDILAGQSAKPGATPWSTGTAASLVLAAVPQNAYGRSQGGGTCTVQLNMPPGAITIHTQGSATDVSNATRQIMQGVSQALADNETIRQIMDGVTG